MKKHSLEVYDRLINYLLCRNDYKYYKIFSAFYGKDRIEYKSFGPVADVKAVLFNHYLVPGLYSEELAKLTAKAEAAEEGSTTVKKRGRKKKVENPYESANITDITDDVYQSVIETFNLTAEDILKLFIEGKNWTQVRTGDLTIYFPEVEVENESGLKTTIYDYFIRLELSNGKFRQLLGTKTTYTLNQLAVGYVHSHRHQLSGDYDLSFTRHCLGSYETPLNRTIGNFHSMNICDDISDSSIRVTCVQIRDYISVESIDGGPYIRIATINGGEDSNSTIDYMYHLYRDNGFLSGRSDDRLPKFGVRSSDTGELPSIYTYSKVINEIADSIISKKLLKYTIINNNLTFSDNIHDLALKMSKITLDYLNENNLQPIDSRWGEKIILKCILTGSKITAITSDYGRRDSSYLESMKELLEDFYIEFNGKTYNSKIIEDKEKNVETTINIISYSMLRDLITITLSKANSFINNNLTIVF